jgi:outer membrane lipoprotein SlyB
VALDPELIGSRVVIRRVLRGETGPSGGPAMTDVLGDLTRWSPAELTVRRDDGSELIIDQADVVAAKQVPARPTARRRRS